LPRRRVKRAKSNPEWKFAAYAGFFGATFVPSLASALAAVALAGDSSIVWRKDSSSA
jgi:hypothetical protein